MYTGRQIEPLKQEERGMRAGVLGLALGMLGATTVTADEGSHVSWSNPLYFNTEFHESGKMFSMRMRCGSTGRPDCAEAYVQLYNLTDTPVCRELFFIAIIDQGTFVQNANVEDNPSAPPWVELSLLVGRHNTRIDTTLTFESDGTPFDCEDAIMHLLF